MLSCLILLITPAANGGDVSKSATDFGVALMYLFTVTIASLYLWYRPVYSGYMKGTCNIFNTLENALYFSIFLLFFTFHILFTAYMTLGFSGSGSAGIINMISAFAIGKVVAGVFCAVTSAGWFLSTLSGIWIMKHVYAHFKERGLSIEDARKDIVGIGIREGVSSSMAASA
jgi:hypothetical protein